MKLSGKWTAADLTVIRSCVAACLMRGNILHKYWMRAAACTLTFAHIFVFVGAWIDY